MLEPDVIMAAAPFANGRARTELWPICAADRRHMQDRDIERLRENIMTKLNLEMGNTPEIVDVALKHFAR